MQLKKFKEIIEEFVADNFSAEGCISCSEKGTSIVPDDFGKKPTDYDKAIKKLFNSLID